MRWIRIVRLALVALAVAVLLWSRPSSRAQESPRPSGQTVVRDGGVLDQSGDGYGIR